jgi:hypothetical protein
MMIYKAKDLPTCEVLERGSDGAEFPEPYDCCEVSLDWELDAKYIIVITDGTVIPGSWLNTLKRERATFDWIRVAPDSIRAMVSAAPPYLCIWRHYDGPRPWCQHGGDEDWTVVMKTPDYEEQEYGELRIDDVDNMGHEAEEGEFTVYTGAHA